MHKPPHTRSIVIVNAGTGDPSSTGLLVHRIAERALTLAPQHQLSVTTRVINLRTVATDISNAMVSGFISAELQAAIDLVREADGLVVGTPVYNAAASSLFTGFFQVLDNDLLIGMPVVLAGTGGSERHSLVVDDQMRGQFAYLRTLTTPTAVYATPSDWQAEGFITRIDRAATELLLLIEADFAGKLRRTSWQSYEHSFSTTAANDADIDFSSDLMRLAAGGAQ